MVQQLINTLLQLLAFAFIPFLVYVIRYKTVTGFLDYIGLKNSTRKANLIALMLSIIPMIPFLMFIDNEAFLAIMKDPKTVTGKLAQMGVGVEAGGTLLLIALVKTSFTEEILFRGFVAKRLAAWLGFKAGNFVQALLFGAIHLVFFLEITSQVLQLALAFILPTAFAYIIFIVNEKQANGSIIPGWIAHAMGNLVAYTTVCFLV
ncbi:MAG TPA: hypothetical protein DCS93_16010 [Microscillaceae bacterium]|nr:hypothetical protein [Microscillaceae bacterium]